MLSIENLSIAFKNYNGELTTVVKDCNLAINKGETVALVGESGSGKTLTALSIMQLLPRAARISADTRIVYDEHDLLNLPAKATHKFCGRRISMIFQEAIAALNPVLTIGQQIDEVLRRHLSLTKKQRKARILSLLNDVGIKDPVLSSRSYPHQLSGGMRQRAMIAMALAPEPELLIADEPTTALDVTLQAQILTLLKQLQRKRGMGILFITHDLGIVKQIADSVVVMKDGIIVEASDTNIFFANPAHAYSRQLFNAIPDFHQVKDKRDNADILLHAEHLSVYFPIKKGFFKRTVDYNKAVDNVNFTIEKGKTLALVGESGSGKTTIAKSIVQLYQQTSGSILLEGQQIDDEHVNDVQMIFQDPYAAMNPRMLVADIIVEGLVAQQIVKSSRECIDRIDELLTMVALPTDCKYRYPHEFSGGQRQRICIARTLALSPKLIICDEPTSALDVSVQQQILTLLKALQEKMRLSYLLITHNFAVVAELADDVAVMHNGQLVEQGPVSQVLKNPVHPYTQKLLDSVPVL